MNHPGPLLTDYVDGTLDPSTRAEVDAHLRTCATCRGELSLVRAGAGAAQGLSEPVAPEGLGEAAIAEAARVAAERNPEITPIAGRARRRPATSRVLAAAGAAAAILLFISIGPKLGQGSDMRPAANLANGAGAAASPAGAYPSATGVEIQHVDYASDSLTGVVERLRTSFAAAAPIASQVSGAAEATRGPSFPTPQTSADPSLLPKATACLNQAFGNPSGTLSRVILASYQGQPAYFGVYLIGPGADLPPTLLQLNVASVHGCQLLSQTTGRL